MLCDREIPVDGTASGTCRADRALRRSASGHRTLIFRWATAHSCHGVWIGQAGAKEAERVHGPVRSPVLVLGAMTALAATAAADLASGEHPTHSFLLVLTTLVVLCLCRSGSWRALPTLRAACAAVIAQPVLHSTSISQETIPSGQDGSDLLHLVTNTVLTAVVQVGVPAIAMLAVAALVQLVGLLVGRVRCLAMHRIPPLPLPIGPCASSRARPHGSLLRSCGWAIRAARRGPPGRPSHAPVYQTSSTPSVQVGVPMACARSISARRARPS